MRNLGFVYAICAYFLWGMAPLYWKALSDVPSMEIVAHRMVWSCVFALMIVLLSRHWSQLTALIRQPRVVARLVLASILVSVNWAIYIWAVNSGNIVQSAMGYFINPLINVFFGFLFFQERLNRMQMVAIGCAAAGVMWLIASHGELPWIALSLAVTFALYGVVKKTIRVPAVHGMAVETTFVFLPALGYLLYVDSQGSSWFAESVPITAMLIIGGAFTLAPLLFFAAAAKRISLTALGMTQYLGPSLQLIIGVWIFNEPFASDQQITFALIWLGLLIYTLDQWQSQRRARVTIPA
ncbi:MAG: EamA family transporter RarD [Gammaproteobacteria bacterium]|nr:EamA family transporter RarD [Gammaproteobacteria bacterium]